ncbi:MAG: type II secretion system protein GspM [Pseudomonadota bacterium]
MDGIKQWFTALTLREQILIGVLAALLALTALFYGVVRPLWLGSWNAETSYRQTALRAAGVQARLDLLAEAPPPRAPVSNGPLATQISADAAERGFALESNVAGGSDMTTITLSGANATALMQWLLALEKQGVVVQQLSMQPIAQGNVAVRADLMRIKPQ